MKEQNQQNQKTENQKDTSAKQQLHGPEKPSTLEKAAETIAGDSQLMSSLLKLLLSPFTLIAGVGLIVYLFFKNKSYKDEIAKLKEENKKLSEERLLYAETSQDFKNKYKRLQKVFEAEQSMNEQRALPQGNYINNVNKNKVTYLR